jgi:DNA-binding transcriptional MerR regulator
VDELKRYTITEVSEMVSMKDYQIRNAEKYLELIFARDSNNNRYFTDKDIEILKIVKQAREHNIPYDVIKKQLSTKGLIDEINEENIEKTELEKLTMIDLKEVIRTTVSSAIAEALIERERELTEELEKRYEDKLDNKIDQLKEDLLKRQEIENDKLMQYIAVTREKEKEEKKGFFAKLFGR